MSTEKRKKSLPITSSVFAFLSLFCYWLLTIVSKESGENTTLVLILLGISFAVHLVNVFTDVFKIPTLLCYAFDFIGLFGALAGRVSYLAFFFCGDIMNTGLSVSQDRMDIRQRRTLLYGRKRQAFALCQRIFFGTYKDRRLSWRIRLFLAFRRIFGGYGVFLRRKHRIYSRSI